MLKDLIKQKYDFNEDENLLNQGVFGQVFSIKDRKVKTEYVLKKIVKSVPGNKKILGTDDETFQNEIDFLTRVKGTNIVKIIDFFSNPKDKFYYIILEKMDGDLEEMLDANKGKMSSKLIRKIFKQLNSGFKLMVKEKKVHRDLKPSNILFTYTNDEKSDFIVKLGDFGLSTDLYKTDFKSNAGTLFFKAPEVQNGIYSNKCDLYSIGVILFMLKTGEIIFQGNNDEERILSKINGNLKKIKDDEKLNDLISKLVVKDPHDRIDWKDYFNHPFFKVKDDENQNLSNVNEINAKNKEIAELKKKIENLTNNYEKKLKQLNLGKIDYLLLELQSIKDKLNKKEKGKISYKNLYKYIMTYYIQNIIKI